MAGAAEEIPRGVGAVADAVKVAGSALVLLLLGWSGSGSVSVSVSVLMLGARYVGGRPGGVYWVPLST
jgi:hypothetical protein